MFPDPSEDDRLPTAASGRPLAASVVRRFGRQPGEPLIELLAYPQAPAADVPSPWSCLPEQGDADSDVAGRALSVERGRQVLILGTAVASNRVSLDGVSERVETLRLGAQRVDVTNGGLRGQMRTWRSFSDHRSTMRGSRV